MIIRIGFEIWVLIRSFFNRESMDITPLGVIYEKSIEILREARKVVMGEFIFLSCSFRGHRENWHGKRWADVKNKSK